MTTPNNETKVITGKVRLSFVNLLRPKAGDDGVEKYSCMLLIPKSDKETLRKIKAAQEAAFEKNKHDKLKGVKDIKQVKKTLRDGDEEMDTEERPEYANHYFMNVSSMTAPQIIDKYKEKVTSEDEVYSGVYARVSINAFAYNTKGNKGITFGLNNVQILAHGEFLGGRSSADADFDEWEDDEDEDFDL